MISISNNDGVVSLMPAPVKAVTATNVEHVSATKAPYRESIAQSAAQFLKNYCPLWIKMGYGIPLMPFVSVNVEATQTLYGQKFVHAGIGVGPSVGLPVSVTAGWPAGKIPGPGTLRANQVGIDASMHANAIFGVSRSTSGRGPVVTASLSAGFGVGASIGFEVGGSEGDKPPLKS